MKTNFFLGVATLLLLASCTKQIDKGVFIKGTVEGFDTKEIILGIATNSTYNEVLPIDTIKVDNNIFEYKNDTLATGLYGMYPITETLTNNNIVYTLLDNGNLTLNIGLSKSNTLETKISGTKVVDEYQEFIDRLNERSMKHICDSLDNEFYEARRAGDRERMMEIKEKSNPTYIKSREERNNFIKEELSKNRNDILGIYMYYEYAFLTMKYSTKEEIDIIKNKLSEYNESAKSTFFYKRMTQKLSKAEQSVVGAVAPEVKGFDVEGNEMKISDFRGKYVIVDFWSSGCTWCRKETPNIKRVYDDFKDKNFTVLAASLDINKEDWMKAVEEDGIYWPSMMLAKEEIRKMAENYNILGIPLIILLSPEGVILEKDLRGERIYEAVKEQILK